jgi:hypothetical protein
MGNHIIRVDDERFSWQRFRRRVVFSSEIYGNQHACMQVRRAKETPRNCNFCLSAYAWLF